MDFFGISSLFSSVSGDNKYYIEPFGKFKNDDINAYFFPNFESNIFVICGAFLGYLMSTILVKILYKFGPYHTK